MRTSSKAALSALGLALVAAVAGHAQDNPESILPPGFNQPVAPGPQNSPAPSAGNTPPVPATVPSPGETPSPTPSASASLDPVALAQYELPDYARRSLDRVGASGPEGLPDNAFGRADGRYLEMLMRRLDAPIASRWLSIALRRALASAVDTPPGVNGADFAAERALLLVRMGEATAARAVVQGVDPDRATAKLIQVTMQAALATGDPAALCPYAATGEAATGEGGWALAKAMCFGLSGEPAQAGAAIDAARRRIGRTVDVSLAEKVVGAGAQGRRAVTIEWPSDDRLTAWRWGLAAATGVEVPAEFYATAGPQVRYWHALSPIYSAAVRAPDAELAAGQGVLSNLTLVDLYGEIADDADNASAALATARDLRTAYADASADDRIGALKGLWDEPKTDLGRYGRLVLTARAAARIRPGDGAAEADRLIGSILTAGLDRSAQRWAGTTKRGSDGWAMLLLSNPRDSVLPYSEVGAYAGSVEKQRMLFAGLAGLGRLRPSEIGQGIDALGVDLNRSDAWTRAIDAAARADQPGTVILLCAVGMQTRDWRGVRPDMLYRMVAALRATGLGGYGRMIAAEAIARL